MKDDLILTHPYRYLEPVKTDSSASVTVYWGGNDGGKTPNSGKINFLLKESSLARKLRQGEVVVLAEPEPNDLGKTFPASRLLDGKLPNDGWRSS